jgi:hypothetical protein
MLMNVMSEPPFYRTLLLEGRTRLLRQLVQLAKDPLEAERILADIDQLNDKLMQAEDSPAGLDYSAHTTPNVAIARWLKQTGRPATQNQIVQELVRGHYPGWRNAKTVDISVGRCIRSYLVGSPNVKPKFKVINGRVGLLDWEDERFQ